jgi:hypothetical protein
LSEGVADDGVAQSDPVRGLSTLQDVLDGGRDVTDPVHQVTMLHSHSLRLLLRSEKENTRPKRPYQIWQRAARTILSPAAQWNAAWNSGMFESVPRTRYLSQGCSLVSAIWRIIPSVAIERHTCA